LLGAGVSVFNTPFRAVGKGRLSRSPALKESDMHRFLDNLAPVLLVVPFAVAAVSVIVTVLGVAQV